MSKTPEPMPHFVLIITEEAVVPSLGWFEIRAYPRCERTRKRITESDTGVFLRDLAGLRVGVDREPEESVVLRLARSHGLSVYYASYLELAVREDHSQP